MLSKVTQESNSNSSFKFPVPKCQHVIDWAKEGFDHLVEQPDMAKRSFEVCCISSSDSLKVCITSFYYKQCMEQALRNLEDDVEESEDDPFIMIVEDYILKSLE